MGITQSALVALRATERQSARPDGIASCLQARVRQSNGVCVSVMIDRDLIDSMKRDLSKTWLPHEQRFGMSGEVVRKPIGPRTDVWANATKPSIAVESNAPQTVYRSHIECPHLKASGQTAWQKYGFDRYHKPRRKCPKCQLVETIQS